MITWRKTSQLLAPASWSPATGIYNVYPAQAVSCKVFSGFRELAALIAGRISSGNTTVDAKSRERVVIDGTGGVLWEDFRARLDAELRSLELVFDWINMGEALLPESEIERRMEPFLGGSDPLFGTRNTRDLAEFFDPACIQRLQAKAFSTERTIVYGTGAALRHSDGLLIYADVPKNEIQFRSRAGSIRNLGCAQPQDPKAMYKRFYFVDWPALRSHQQRLASRIDLFIDAQRPDDPATAPGPGLRQALEAIAHSCFRVRPWFEPGPWGGQWMKNRFTGLNPEAPNLAWSFELISPENGLAFENSGRLIEIAFDFLMFQCGADVLGNFATRFGFEFPIRFDYLDTFEGGNLSLQCHPRPAYVRTHFGENFTQDETYYITDCGPGAQVFLGFREDLNVAGFKQGLETSYREAAPFPVTQFVQSHASTKHSLYLIPNGTIHCSGTNNLVLEISATPYIFTFKMYDWMRLDLDGRPRTLNIDRALENLYFERSGEAVKREFISQPRTIGSGPGWSLVHLPTHREHFYDVHRFDLDPRAAITAHTNGSPHVLNVVEGSSLTLEIDGFAPRVFAFAETFVIPASAKTYTLQANGSGPLKVIKAFLKPSAV